jgi:hypothetical protein
MVAVMNERPEADGPAGDPDRHLPLAQLQALLAALPLASPDRGVVRLIVRRRADGTRETPQRAILSPQAGLPGDRWERRVERDTNEQLAVMRREVAELIANGQPLTTFGDNLFVDFDLSAANLPAGSRLRVGQALVEMTPEPHNGCRKFKARFGQDALKLVSEAATRAQNLRGVYWKVIEPGEVAVGDPIRLLSRPG